jgi:hypothetical protein
VLEQRRGPDSSRLLLGQESSCDAFPNAGPQTASPTVTELMTHQWAIPDEEDRCERLSILH